MVERINPFTGLELEISWGFDVHALLKVLHGKKPEALVLNCTNGIWGPNSATTLQVTLSTFELSVSHPARWRFTGSAIADRITAVNAGWHSNTCIPVTVGGYYYPPKQVKGHEKLEGRLTVGKVVTPSYESGDVLNLPIQHFPMSQLLYDILTKELPLARVKDFVGLSCRQVWDAITYCESNLQDEVYMWEVFHLLRLHELQLSTSLEDPFFAIRTMNIFYRKIPEILASRSDLEDASIDWYTTVKDICEFTLDELTLILKCKPAYTLKVQQELSERWRQSLS